MKHLLILLILISCTGEVIHTPTKSFADASVEEMSYFIDESIKFIAEQFYITVETPEDYKKRRDKLSKWETITRKRIGNINEL